MNIVKTILVGNKSLLTYPNVGDEVSTRYYTALGIVQNYIDNRGKTFEEAKTAAKTFFSYVTDTLGKDLYYEESDDKYIAYTIITEVIGEEFFDLSPLTSMAVEDVSSSSPFYNNYVSYVDEIVASYVGANLSTSKEMLSLKGYFLEQEGFTDNIVCSLNTIFFTNYKVEDNLLVGVNTTPPNFTVIFEADSINTSKLKNYSFYLYYHDREKQALFTLEENEIKNYLVEISKTDSFLKDIEDGIIYIDVGAIFAATGIKVELWKAVPPAGKTIIDTNGLYPTNFEGVEVKIYDTMSTLLETSYDFVELILVPPISLQTAEITLVDIII